MKLHKFILFLNLVVGAYSITNDDANAQRNLKEFVCQMNTCKPVAIVFANSSRNCIHLKSCNV